MGWNVTYLLLCVVGVCWLIAKVWPIHCFFFKELPQSSLVVSPLIAFFRTAQSSIYLLYNLLISYYSSLKMDGKTEYEDLKGSEEVNLLKQNSKPKPSSSWLITRIFTPVLILIIFFLSLSLYIKHIPFYTHIIEGLTLTTFQLP